MAAYDMMQDLQKSYPDLTQAQKRIAEAIVEDPEFVAFASIDKFASKLGVASSTIVRFAYRLGLEGYPDLQDQVREIVKSRLRPNSAFQLDGESTLAHLPDGLLGRSLHHDIDNVQRTILDLDPDTVQSALDLLTSARRVYFMGGYASDWLAEYCALSVNRIRGDAWAINHRDAALALLDIKDNDVLVAFSFPPYASETMQFVRAAQKRGVSIIGMTDSPISPLGRVANLTLTSHVSGVGPQNSLVGPMMLVNALLNGVANQSENCVERYGEIFEQMDEWNTFILRGDRGSDA
jgi:DNA-binding MurR/RpiR family transcriptional regulator